MKEKDAEVEQLNTELIGQKEEPKDLGEVLKETREVNHDLKTQLEEAKRIEEIMKIQLEEKEETIQKLEMEVVGLRKKGGKNESFVEFKDILIVLDKILDFQRSPLDKTGLGYKKDKGKSKDDTWSPKTPEGVPSTSKVDTHAPAYDNKDVGSSRMQQRFRSIPQRKIRK